MQDLTPIVASLAAHAQRERFSAFGTAPTSPPDERDHGARRYLRMAAAPRAKDLGNVVGLANVRYYPGIRDQSFEGSCTGFDMRGVRGTQERRQRKRKRGVPEFGPRGIYNLAKEMGGYPNEEGAYMRDVAKAVAHHGTPREIDWPYIAQQPGAPDKDFAARAKHWAISGYGQCRTIGEMISALEGVGPLFAAMDLHENFLATGSDGKVASPSGSSIGGHAMCFLAADQDTREFLVANSWGTNWGNAGYCTITFDHFLKVDSEAWVIYDA